MSGGGGSQTSTTKTEIPQYIQDAQQHTLKTAQDFATPFLANPPSSLVAGFTPDQTKGFDLSRLLAQNTFNAPGMTAPNTAVAPSYANNYIPKVQWQNQTSAQQADTPDPVSSQVWNPASSGSASQMAAAQSLPSLMQASTAGAAATSNPLANLATQGWSAANSGPAALGNAASGGGAATTDTRAGQVAGRDIHALLNPYTRDVLDPTIERMRQELGQTQAQIGARNASAASFGGSRGALQSAEANRAFGDQVALTTGQLMSQGYDHATATALANAQNAQQAGEFNAGQTNQMGQFNAGLQQQTGLANQAALNAVAEANAQRMQQANSGNAAAENAMRQFNTTTGQQNQQFNAGQLNQRGEFNANLLDIAQRSNQGALNAAAEANAGRQQQAGASNQAANNAVAEANAARQQQANAGNSAAENAMRQFNAGQLDDISKFNAGQFNQNDQFYAAQRAAADAANAGYENTYIGRQQDLSQNDANRSLSAATLQNTFANDEARRQATALQQLLGTGATQQANDQSTLNQPMDMLRLLQSVTPGNIPTSSSTTQPTQSNPIGTLAGLATIGSMLFSDRRDKTDIKKLGNDTESGLDIYAYRYRGDPKNTQKVVGPMAQDVEKKYPGTVYEIGGHKVIDMTALTALLGTS